MPSTGYVGMPVLSYDPVKADGKQDPRVDVGGPDGGLFVFAEAHDCEWAATAGESPLRFDDSYYDGMGMLTSTTNDPHQRR